jgi:paraquat-inducible protein A
VVITQTLIACHECDLLHRVQQPLPRKSKARCSRCGALLYVNTADPVTQPLALAITGLLLLIIANLYPFLSLESQGTVLQTTLISGTIMLSRQSMTGLALLVLLTSMLIPAVLLGALTYVLGPMKGNHRLPAVPRVFRLALSLRPWSMTEVFLLGILVSVVKLAGIASIIPGTALYAFLALVFVLAAVNTILDPHAIWENIEPW